MIYKQEENVLLRQLERSVCDLKGAYIAGGAITSIFSAARINDFDVYFTSDALMQKGLAAVKENKPDSVVETDCAYSFKLNGTRYQIIKIYAGEPSEIIKKFDFSVCQAAWQEKKGFTFADGFFHHLGQRRLVFNVNTEFPISSLYRVRKYLKRGFTLSGIEAIKLGLAIQRLEIKTYKELRRQIMGIDTLFLRDLTDSLKSQEEKGYEFNEFLRTLDDWLEKLNVDDGDDL